jgi:hypothetical protein
MGKTQWGNIVHCRNAFPRTIAVPHPHILIMRAVCVDCSTCVILQQQNVPSLGFFIHHFLCLGIPIKTY